MAGLNDMIARLVKMSKSRYRYIRESQEVQRALKDLLSARDMPKDKQDIIISRVREDFPTAKGIRKQREDFKQNFEEIVSDAGGDINAWSGNKLSEFIDFVDAYRENIKSQKYRDSAQLVTAFEEYKNPANKYNSMSDFWESYSQYTGK